MASHQEEKNDPTSVQHLPSKDEEEYVTQDDVLKGAQQATDEELKMSLREAIRRYPTACFFSALFSCALIMEGFDKAFITAFFAFPAFQKRYGELTSTGEYEVPADVQAGVNGGVSAGQIIGLAMNSYLADRFGYRRVMLGCLFFMVCFVFIQFFASSIYMYLGAGILLGIPWGVFQVITTTYASEICPTVLRPYLTSLVSMCWSIGYLLGTGVLTAFLKMEGQWAYRIPFALQWVLPIPLAIGILLAPESPWWLVRKNRVADAEVALRKLRKKDVDDEEIANTLSMMVYTIKIENDMNTSSAYKDLFKGENLRRTEITVFTYVIQEICVPMLSYVVYFLQQAGLPTSVAFKFGLGQYSLAIVGVVVAWFLTPHFGRRTLILSGISFVTATTFLIGFLGIPTSNPITYGNAIGSILLLQYFVFFFTCGPVIYTVVTEIPSSYLRSKSVSLARATYNVNVIIYGQLMPRTTQKAWWNWGAKAGFFYGGIMCIGIIWGYFRLPETKGRTFAEIDILFKNKVRARDFTKTKVDIANQTVSREE
ncbi:hypothetical protein V495_05078 [Pseudogymnoascus sp. VKM F-4514 (FW-929)]|nr:hypothetical protein V495_05078 [Pseudogymnoascus sp. VKM F-4514 (FW-929)]KFY53852.1 hypothetical protein V497_08176 [Pseudogymnoascus sp. VKM F-4516 (FW-969)]